MNKLYRMSDHIFLVFNDGRVSGWNGYGWVRTLIIDVKHLQKYGTLIGRDYKEK